MSKNLIATLENYNPEFVNSMLAQPDVDVATINDDLSEQAELVREIEDHQGAFEEGLKAHDHLTEVQEIAKNCEASDIPALVATHETIMRNLGLDTIVSTMEGHQTTSGLLATMESDTKGIFSKLMALAKRGLEIVMSFLLKLFQSTKGLNKYQEMLRARVLALDDDDRPKETEMTSSASAMSTDGEADQQSVTFILDTASIAVQMADLGFETLKEIDFKSISNIDIEASLSEENEGTKTFNKLTQTLEKMLGSLPTHKGGDGFFTGDRTAKMAGGGLQFSSPEIKNVAKKAQVLSKKAMLKALDKVASVNSELQALEKKRSGVKASYDKFMSLVKFFANAAVARLTPSAEQKAKAFLRVLSNGIQYAANNVISKFMNESFKSMKAVLDYVRNSLAQYSKS